MLIEMHMQERVENLHSQRLSCQVDRPPAKTEEQSFHSLSDCNCTEVLLQKWIFGASKGNCTGNFPVFLKSVRVHN